MIRSINAPIARDTFKGSLDPRKRVHEDDEDDDDPKESKRIIPEDEDDDFDLPLDDDIKGFDEYDDEDDDDY